MIYKKTSGGGGAAGANTTLSNLGVTAVNTNIKPDATDTWELGSSSRRWGDIYTSSWRGANLVCSLTASSLTTPSGNSACGIWATSDAVIYTNNNATANASPTATLYIESGNKTAGTGNSGDIKIKTGTSAGGTMGDITLQGKTIRLKPDPSTGVVYLELNQMIPTVNETSSVGTYAVRFGEMASAFINLASAVGNLSPNEGDVWYDPGAGKLKVYTSGGWETIVSA